MGLSVVYGVVNSHNGFIAVQSEPGHGSEFSLYFPIILEGGAVGRREKHSRLPRGKEKVLVIDDEEHVGEVIGGMLKNLGYKVSIATSGQEAISLLESRKQYDAVVLDMNMPEMGGRETFYRLKELNPDLRVVISTGYTNTSIDGTPLRDAIDGFLQKPYQLEELSKTMREIFDRSA